MSKMTSIKKLNLDQAYQLLMTGAVKPVIGKLGGRFYVGKLGTDTVKFKLNQLYKLVNKSLAQVEKLDFYKVQFLNKKIKELDAEGIRLLADKTKTTQLQRIHTRTRQIFGIRFNRKALHQKLDRIAEKLLKEMPVKRKAPAKMDFKTKKPRVVLETETCDLSKVKVDNTFAKEYFNKRYPALKLSATATLEDLVKKPKVVLETELCDLSKVKVDNRLATEIFAKRFLPVKFEKSVGGEDYKLRKPAKKAVRRNSMDGIANVDIKRAEKTVNDHINHKLHVEEKAKIEALEKECLNLLKIELQNLVYFCKAPNKYEVIQKRLNALRSRFATGDHLKFAHKGLDLTQNLNVVAEFLQKWLNDDKFFDKYHAKTTQDWVNGYGVLTIIEKIKQK